jgi:hypothetical protein
MPNLPRKLATALKGLHIFTENISCQLVFKLFGNKRSLKTLNKTIMFKLSAYT